VLTIIIVVDSIDLVKNIYRQVIKPKANIPAMIK
jgi:hypothetical protein